MQREMVAEMEKGEGRCTVDRRVMKQEMEIGDTRRMEIEIEGCCGGRSLKKVNGFTLPIKQWHT